MHVLDRKEGLIYQISEDVLNKLFTFDLQKICASFRTQTCMFLKRLYLTGLRTWTREGFSESRMNERAGGGGGEMKN